MAFVELPVETHPLVGLLGRGQVGNPAIFNRRGGAVQRNLQAVAKKQPDLVDVGLRRQGGIHARRSRGVADSKAKETQNCLEYRQPQL
jgi:hypothetical protein